MNRLSGVLNKIDRAIGLLSGLAVGASAISVVGLAFLITANMLVRELRAAGYIGFIWNFVEEWSGYLLVLLIFFALAYTLRTEGHINVNVLVRFLPRRARDAVETFTTALALAMLVYMLYRSVTWLQMIIERNIVSNFPTLTPMWIPALFVPIGLSLFGLAITLHLLRKALATATGAVEEEKPEIPKIVL